MESSHLSLCLVVILAVTLATGVVAQETEIREGGIGIGPLKLMADATPGQTWEGSFRIVGSVPGRRSVFDIEVRDLKQSVIGHKKAVEIGEGARSASDWIIVASDVSVDGTEQRDISVAVTVPEDAFGAYSSFLVVNLRPAGPAAQFSATVVPTVNVEVLVRVRSSGPLELGVEGIELGRSNDGESEILVDVRNSGVWVSELRGDVLMYPESGGFPERIELPYRSDGRPFELYPGQTMRLRAPSPRVPPGMYRAVGRLELGERRESRSEFALAVSGTGGAAAADLVEGAKSELGTDIWIEQPVHEFSLPPGAVRSVPIRVSNLGESAVTLDVVVEDARLEADGQWTYASSPIPTPGLTVEVAPDTLVLGPKESSAVRATVQMDRDAQFDATVTKGVRFVGRSGEESGEWQTVYDAGALLIIKPRGGGHASLRVKSLDLVRSHPESNPGSAVLTISNEGDGVGEVRGRVLLHSDAGELVAEMAIGSRRWERVMPQGDRKFRMSLPLVAEGVFTVSVDLEQKGNEGEPLTADASFTSTEIVPEGL